MEVDVVYKQYINLQKQDKINYVGAIVYNTLREFLNMNLESYAVINQVLRKKPSLKDQVKNLEKVLQKLGDLLNKNMDRFGEFGKNEILFSQFIEPFNLIMQRDIAPSLKKNFELKFNTEYILIPIKESVNLTRLDEKFNFMNIFSLKHVKQQRLEQKFSTDFGLVLRDLIGDTEQITINCFQYCLTDLVQDIEGKDLQQEQIEKIRGFFLQEGLNDESINYFLREIWLRPKVQKEIIELKSYSKDTKNQLQLIFLRNITETRFKQGHEWEIDQKGLVGSKFNQKIKGNVYFGRKLNNSSSFDTNDIAFDDPEGLISKRQCFVEYSPWSGFSLTCISLSNPTELLVPAGIKYPIQDYVINLSERIGLFVSEIIPAKGENQVKKDYDDKFVTIKRAGRKNELIWIDLIKKMSSTVDEQSINQSKTDLSIIQIGMEFSQDCDPSPQLPQVFEKNQIRIGSAPDNDIVIKDAQGKVMPQQCQLTVYDYKLYLETCQPQDDSYTSVSLRNYMNSKEETPGYGTISIIDKMVFCILGNMFEVRYV